MKLFSRYAGWEQKKTGVKLGAGYKKIKILIRKVVGHAMFR